MVQTEFQIVHLSQVKKRKQGSPLSSLGTAGVDLLSLSIIAKTTSSAAQCQSRVAHSSLFVSILVMAGSRSRFLAISANARQAEISLAEIGYMRFARKVRWAIAVFRTLLCVGYCIANALRLKLGRSFLNQGSDKQQN